MILKVWRSPYFKAYFYAPLVSGLIFTIGLLSLIGLVDATGEKQYLTKILISPVFTFVPTLCLYMFYYQRKNSNLLIWPFAIFTPALFLVLGVPAWIGIDENDPGTSSTGKPFLAGFLVFAAVSSFVFVIVVGFLYKFHLEKKERKRISEEA